MSIFLPIFTASLLMSWFYLKGVTFCPHHRLMPFLIIFLLLLIWKYLQMIVTLYRKPSHTVSWRLSIWKPLRPISKIQIWLRTLNPVPLNWLNNTTVSSAFSLIFTPHLLPKRSPPNLLTCGWLLPSWLPKGIVATFSVSGVDIQGPDLVSRYTSAIDRCERRNPLTIPKLLLNTLVRSVSLVSSRLDYCNSLLFGIAETGVTKLQRILNRLARVATKSAPFIRSVPLLRSLHWLPVKYRVHFKICLLTYKALYKEQPVYLRSLITTSLPSRSLRSNRGITLSIPRIKTNTGARAFSSCAPSLWNNLPLSVRSKKTRLPPSVDVSKHTFSTWPSPP